MFENQTNAVLSKQMQFFPSLYSSDNPERKMYSMDV